MGLERKLEKLESTRIVQGLEAERGHNVKARRLMELIALGTLRAQGQRSACEASLTGKSEDELLNIIGADKQGYESAVRDLARWRRNEPGEDKKQ
jgi:hypothetical protein